MRVMFMKLGIRILVEENDNVSTDLIPKNAPLARQYNQNKNTIDASLGIGNNELNLQVLDSIFTLSISSV